MYISFLSLEGLLSLDPGESTASTGFAWDLGSGGGGGYSLGEGTKNQVLPSLQAPVDITLL